ncbi:MAG: dienelactone hydrolase family protein [Salinibacter sp.]
MNSPLFGALLTILLVCSGCSADRPGVSAEAMAAGHEGDTPVATDAAREPAAPVDGREVTYGRSEDGPALTGYLAAPSNPDSVLSAHGRDPSSARLPGIVVIHEWWGLNDNIRSATRRLAGKGYRALAVDLYGDSTAQTPQQAQSLMQAATRSPEQITANLQAAHQHLTADEGAPRVAVMGWCFGGGMTFRAVADRPTAFDAAVAYYGSPEAMTPSVLEQLTTPILAHFGRQDQVVPPKQGKAFRSRLDGRSVNVQVYMYDAGHAFANPSGESYDAEAAKRAWSRTTAFLQTHLHPHAN